MKWLNDNVYSIRVAAITNLKELTKLLGSQWAERNIIKNLMDLKNEINYLHRLTPLFGIAELSQVISSDIIKKNFTPMLLQMSKDKIPNIRMNVAKAIMTIRVNLRNTKFGAIENSIEADLLQILNDMKNDPDDDVKFYTKKAIALKN